MSFLWSILLVAVAAVLAVAGAVTSNAALFVCAAAASAAAVVVLWRRVVAERENVFGNAPHRGEPDWNRTLLRPDDNTETLRAVTMPPADDSLGKTDSVSLGIPNYDDLVAAEIMPSLETLSVDQLREVIRREQRGLRRATIVRRAQRLIELTGATFEPQPTQKTPIVSRGPGRTPRKRSTLQQKDEGLSL